MSENESKNLQAQLNKIEDLKKTQEQELALLNKILLAEMRDIKGDLSLVKNQLASLEIANAQMRKDMKTYHQLIKIRISELERQIYIPEMFSDRNQGGSQPLEKENPIIRSSKWPSQEVILIKYLESFRNSITTFQPKALNISQTNKAYPSQPGSAGHIYTCIDFDPCADLEHAIYFAFEVSENEFIVLPNRDFLFEVRLINQYKLDLLYKLNNAPNIAGKIGGMKIPARMQCLDTTWILLQKGECSFE